MERLTDRREDGTATGIKRSIGDFVGIPEMLMRLAEYEDTGMTPQDIADLPAHVEEKESEIKRLQAVVEAAKERQKLIINRRQLLCDAPNNHKLIPGLAEAIEEIHQADIRLEQALAAAGYGGGE